MELSLQECEDATQMDPQNPTSQGTYGNKVHVVKPGETMALIANMEYGDSKIWRVIADANGLDNPKDLRPGTVLEIVPLEF
jgi:nucleoid-associated protein YgaU